MSSAFDPAPRASTSTPPSAAGPRPHPEHTRGAPLAPPATGPAYYGLGLAPGNAVGVVDGMMTWSPMFRTFGFGMFVLFAATSAASGTPNLLAIFDIVSPA